MDKPDLLIKVDELVERSNDDAKLILDNLCMSLSSDVLEDHLRYIYRMFDIPFETEEEED